MDEVRPEKFLDGGWVEQPEDEDGYRRFRAGPVEVRFHPDFEEDGELVTHEPVNVHIERMDDGLWWMGLSWGPNNLQMVAIDFWSKKPITPLWKDETSPMLSGSPLHG